VKRPGSHPSSSLWYKEAVFYEIRVRSFYDSNGDGIGDFRGLTGKLDYLEDLGVTALWLLPFYPSPLRDDGYDISDYTAVHPDCGTLRDFKGLLRAAHDRGMRVVTELVLNHTSDQHPWFQRARRAPPGSKERDFYVWSDDPERYSEARVIFQDSEPSNWSWDSLARAYYWHRFYSHQPDLNFHSPEVRREILRVVDFWLALGVDGLRLDAVPYLFEREGTSCENLPETHEFLRELRRHVDRKFGERMLLAEANQWPEDAAAYLEGGRECHMAFHFPLMPRLYLALRMEDRFPITDIWAQTPRLDESCQWALFLRNHDELTLEMVTDEEREFMYRAYAEEPRMRINLGIRRRLAPLLGNNRRAIELLNGLLLSLPGTPVIYYGDEIGMGDNIYLGDRNGVRTPMQWSSDRNAGFSSASSQQLILPLVTDHEYHHEAVNVEAQERNRHSLLWWMKRLIALRKQRQAFGRGTIEFLGSENPRVLSFVRALGDERVLVVANLSRFVQLAKLDLSSFRGLIPVELFGRTEFPRVGERSYYLTLGPHGFYWFDLRLPQAGDARRHGERLPRLSLSGTPRSILHEERALLERTLPAYLGQRRWFGGKARMPKSATIIETVSLDEPGTTVLALVRVEYLEGEPETYLLPLAVAVGHHARELRAHASHAAIAELRFPSETNGYGLVFDALADRQACRTMLDLFSRQRRLRGSEGEVHVVLSRENGLPSRDRRSLEPRPVRGEQSNTSVAFGEALVLKLLRRPGDGISPDLEMGRFLSERRAFAHVAPLEGWLEYRRNGGEPTTFALLHGFVQNRGDAWHYSREELRRYYERALAKKWRPPAPPRQPLLDLLDREPPAEVHHLVGAYLEAACLLGRRVAELHLTLASETEDPAFVAEAYGPLYQRALYQSQRNLAGQSFRLLRRELVSLPEETRRTARWLLKNEAGVVGRFEAARHCQVTAPRIRCHGDLHLGQVLHTGKDFVFIDFEGEPARPVAERRAKRSCLVDVAGMLRSFHYASAMALQDLMARGIAPARARQSLERCAILWQAWSSLQFLRGYLTALGPTPLVPRDRTDLRTLLGAFLLEKAVYELGYDLDHRPGWVWIPLQGIRQLLGAP
jgi:maltose alpha-D-glucosyltransferase / alpha-amylase